MTLCCYKCYKNRLRSQSVLPLREKQVKFSCSVINLKDTLAHQHMSTDKSMSLCSDGVVTQERRITMSEERTQARI